MLGGCQKHTWQSAVGGWGCTLLCAWRPSASEPLMAPAAAFSPLPQLCAASHRLHLPLLWLVPAVCTHAVCTHAQSLRLLLTTLPHRRGRQARGAAGAPPPPPPPPPPLRLTGAGPTGRNRRSRLLRGYSRVHSIRCRRRGPCMGPCCHGQQFALGWWPTVPRRRRRRRVPAGSSMSWSKPGSFSSRCSKSVAGSSSPCKGGAVCAGVDLMHPAVVVVQPAGLAQLEADRQPAHRVGHHLRTQGGAVA